MALHSFAAEYLKLWQSSNPLKTAVTVALMGSVGSHSRSLYWKILLGILPMPSAKESTACLSNWVAASLRERQQFSAAVKASAEQISQAARPAPKTKPSSAPRFGNDSSSDEDEGAVEVTDDPLSNAPSSAWTKKFEQQKLFRVIDNDLDRLWSDVPFFETAETRNDLREVLHAYASASALSYRQGMHEIASLLYYWVVHDADALAVALSVPDTANGDADSVAPEVRNAAEVIFDRKAVVADTFACFSRLMTSSGMELQLLYDVTKAVMRENDFGESMLTRTAEKSVSQNEVVDMSHYIQCAALKKTDERLWKHLNAVHHISPQSYGIRWLRLLFIREFPLTQTSLIWDALFAEFGLARCKGKPYDITTSLLRSISVAMLQYISADLLDRDEDSAVLQRLMRYPPVENVGAILKSAIKLQGDPDLTLAAGQIPPQGSKPLATLPPPGSKGATTLPNPSGSFAEPTKAAAVPRAPTSPGNAPLAQATRALFPVAETVDTLREKQLRMGMVLASVIQRMERKWFPAQAPESEHAHGSSEPSVDEDYVMAIAELKKVKDILLNALPE